MLWSEGLYGGDSYSVAYGMASSPLGPFSRREKILQSDFAVATGTGHNGLLHPPNTDIYYIVYHRHFLHYTAWDDRQLAYDRLHFNPDGTIQPVKLLVRDNFDDGNMLGWTTHGGSWNASSGSLVGGYSVGGKALLNTNFADVGCDMRVTIRGGSQGGDAGFLFHVGDDVGDGADDYQGYYAGISTQGYVVLGRANHGQWTELGRVQRGVSADVAHLLRVRVTGDLIEVLLDDMSKSVISVHDETYRSGKTAVRVFYTKATFDDVVFEHI